MNDALTKQELIEVLDSYIVPAYQIVAGLAAVAVVSLAVYLVLSPFIRRLK